MKAKFLMPILLIIVTTFDLFAEDYSTNAQWVTNYKNWGWEKTIVLGNGLINLSIVPIVGARVLEYDLDGHASLHITEEELGKVYEASDYVKSGAEWRNYGGFRVALLPTDQNSPAGNRFPPPVTIGTGPYQGKIIEQSPEKTTVVFRSATQNLPVPKWDRKKKAYIEAKTSTSQLQMERTMTIYRNSSRVRVEQSLINVGESKTRRGFKGVSQSMVRHGQERDYENFWCYFPMNPNSIMGHSGVSYKGNGFNAGVRTGKIDKNDDKLKKRYASGPMPHWKCEVVPGVFGGHFSSTDASGVFADPHIGWICYVDERDGYLYAKVFNVSDTAIYGNATEGDGTRVSVFNSSIFGD